MVQKLLNPSIKFKADEKKNFQSATPMSFGKAGKGMLTGYHNSGPA